MSPPSNVSSILSISFPNTHGCPLAMRGLSLFLRMIFFMAAKVEYTPSCGPSSTKLCGEKINHSWIWLFRLFPAELMISTDAAGAARKMNRYACKQEEYAGEPPTGKQLVWRAYVCLCGSFEKWC